MRISYDQRKNAKNIRERGLSFEKAAEFDFLNALTLVDTRKEYGEVRYVATGYLVHRLHVICYVEVGDGIRVISFRKANRRECVAYEKANQ